MIRRFRHLRFRALMLVMSYLPVGRAVLFNEWAKGFETGVKVAEWTR